MCPDDRFRVTRGACVAMPTGDGILDVVAANSGASTVSVFAGNGGGTFKPNLAFAVDAAPKSVAIADLHDDDNLNFVWADLFCEREDRE